VDLLVTGTVLDDGKVRWQWMAAGMFADMTRESIALGVATSWNPVALLANAGFELPTGTPVWFGGGYLFGAAFRPVRVEAQAIDAITGETVWDDTEAAIIARERLKAYPPEERKKKEVQLRANLSNAMEALAESWLDTGLTVTLLKERRQPTKETD
jgi:hypothetical protein